MPELRIGCSGFSYLHWKGVFYPNDLSQRRWLEFYSRVFRTVELNVTFYRLPLAKTFETWHQQVPADFAFFIPNIIDLCREHNVSVCMADWPSFIDDLPITADLVYLRRHGRGGSYTTRYTVAELQKDAARIKKYLQNGKSVFIYFNNDAHGYAPENAQQLIELLHRKSSLLIFPE